MMEVKNSDAPVRIAVISDEDGIMNLCQLLHEENGQFDMDEDKVRRELKRAFSREGSMLGVIEGDNGIEGVIFLTIGQLWYSEEWMLEELFNFVHPDHRRSSHAKRLIQFAKDTADHLHIPLIIGVLSNERTEAKVRLYERMLPKSGAYFIYNKQDRAH